MVRDSIGGGLRLGLVLRFGIPNPNLSHNPHSNPYTDCVCSKFNLAKCDLCFSQCYEKM